MSGIQSLELLFNVEKNNITSKEDCVVVAIHSFLLKEGFYCVGIGEKWSESNSKTTTEMLPNEWNRNQNVYSLRYKKRDSRANFLLKITKANDLLLVDVVMNEDPIATMSVPFKKYVSANYNEYSTAYKELESLYKSFRKEVIERIQFAIQGSRTSPKIQKKIHTGSPSISPPTRPQANLERDDDPRRYTFPEIGNRDLDPLGRGKGGMLMDPSSSGIPARPTLPEFGVGTPGGLPRGAVPPGSRFDPISPPSRPGRSSPDPDHLKPPENKPSP